MSTLNELLGTSNLDEEQPWMNKKATIYGLVLSALVVTNICVFARLYVRYFVTRSPGYDDYLVIVTFLMAWAANMGCCDLADAGLGQHFVLLGLEGMANFTRTFWWCNACYNMTLALVKISLLTQYLRLIQERPDIKQNKLRITIIVLLVVVSIWGIIWSILAWIPCWPIEADWDFTDTTATRWAYGTRRVDTFIATFYNHGATNMILDIVVISLPVVSRSLWESAEAQKQSRVGMLCLFALGGLSVICSIVRFAYIVRSKATTYPIFDPTWYGSSTTTLSVLEVDLATIVASLPIFWPHLQRNITSILITHEVEVKFSRQSEYLPRIPRMSTGNQSLHAGGARWDVETGVDRHQQDGAVLMRSLSVSSKSAAAGSTELRDELPQPPNRAKTSSRLGLTSSDSKEILLR